VTSTKDFGNYGESVAVDLLIQKGYLILDRNFKSKFGEIDIIAKNNDTIVFIEVKVRRSIRYGYPEEAVNKHKLKKIKKVAQYYLQTNNVTSPVQIEVVSLLFIAGAMVEAKIFKID